ncbi:MAG TPA: hypothetical protein VJN22_04195 [Candidatus Eremiobacteraceae bacterium]|nr:hypothetical protein [Candidatus Eremiobacteraceae bacterium]
MATATDTKYIPIISSSTVGPLGVMHLPRLWTKLTLGNAGLLPEGHDYCGTGFDQLTISDLGLDRDKVIEFVKTSKPTYVKFEAWVKANGKTDAESIKKHNDAVKGYVHGDDTVKRIQGDIGLADPAVKDAVTLNILEDLHDLHVMAAK